MSQASAAGSSTRVTATTRILIAIAMLVGLATVAVTVARMFYSVDFSDEALYALIPYRFALGAKPFVDELLFQQTSAFLTYPFVKLWYLITGSTAGIILFMRFLSLFFMAAVGGCVWVMIRRTVGRSIALLAVLPCVAFFYFNIPGLGYNTLGLGWLTVGCFLGFFASGDRHKWLTAAGAAHGLAVVAYPSLAIGVAVFAILLFLTSPSEERWEGMLRYALGGGAIAGVLFLVFAVAGFGNVVESYRNTAAAGVFGGGLAKIAMIARAAWAGLEGKAVLAVGFVAALALKRRYPLAAGLILLTAPVAPLFVIGYQGFAQSSGYIAYYALLAPLLFFFARGEPEMDRLLWLVWLPGLAAAAAVSYTTGKGFLAAAVGLFPSALVTSIFLVRAVRRLWARHGEWGRLAGAAALLIPLVALLFYQFNTPYRDDPVALLTARVNSGPYAGLYTGPQKRAFLDSVSRDLTRASAGAKTLFVFENFPAGYLLTPLTPLTDKVWVAPSAMYPRVDRGTTVRYFANTRKYPDLVLKMNRIVYKSDYTEELSYPAKDPLSRWAAGRDYRPAVTRPDYMILHRTTP